MFKPRTLHWLLLYAAGSLSLMSSAARADVTLYTDLAAFNAATNNAAELFQTTAENILLADEETTLPTRNVAVGEAKAAGEGRSLTFQRTNTELFYSFEFTSLQPGNGSLTFDDDEGGDDLPTFNDALSPGDIDDIENDDWRVRILNAQVPLRAFGFELRDNNDTAGEFIRLYDAGGNLVHAVAVGNQAVGNVFLGVVSDEPFSEIRYDEDAGGDDIAVADFRFVAGPNPAPSAVDVFAATPVSTANSPQTATIVLEGSDVNDDPLTYSIVGSPANGTLRDPNNGNAVVAIGAIAGNTLLYTPDTGFTGTDQFAYRVNDGTSNSEVKIATVTVFGSYRSEALQLGADIDGEAGDDLSGYSVALSSDGTTVAIGAYLNDGNGNASGHTRIYRWNGASWVQLGFDIDGEAEGDVSGWSVALSSDGETVAIGAILNDGNGDFAGHTRIYRWNGASWVQLGNDIDGEAGERSGYSLALSSDGITVAIGARLNDESGHVRIYRWNGAGWVQLGADIGGEAAGDRSGFAVDLSSDGQTVAIGAYLNDGNGRDSGHTRVYRWNGASWVQLGADIDGEAADDLSGWSVALSSDGETVAIGAIYNTGNGFRAGHTRIYRWNNASWIQLGADIDGEAAENQSGYAVALSSDGQTAAIGANFNNGSGQQSGHTRIYHWSGVSWIQLGTDIDGEAALDRLGAAVALSSDGQTVAISALGQIGNGGGRGTVRLYDLTLSGSDDNDFDGVANDADAFPDDPTETADSDNDGVGDNADDFPNDPTETTDTDGDGLGDNREAQLGTLPGNPDTDGDGFSDFDEVEAESDPLSADDIPQLGGLGIPVIKAAIDGLRP